MRIAIIFDGGHWFLRGIRSIELGLDDNEKVYRCDRDLGGPFDSLDEAVSSLPTAVAEFAGLTRR